jgi:hypothetical protein
MTPFKTITIYPGRNTRTLQYILFFLIAVLYCYTAYSSFGYDDEYYNIRVVTENNLRDLIRIIQSTDIHPPLSYILNFVLFKLFHNWNSVRIFSAVLFLGSLLYVIYKTKNSNERWWALVLFGLNPTLLLWVTSLRWYAYTTPLLLVLSVLPDYKNKFYWSYFFLCFLLIFFLGYIGFVLFVPYFLFYWFNDRNEVKKKVIRVLVPGVVFTIIYARQLFVFLTVHSKSELGSNNQQTFDLKTNLISVASSEFSNQGVFPLTIWGIVSMVGSSIIILLSVFYFRDINKKKHWLVFSLSMILLVLAGIAGKIRNLVLLEPSRNLFIISSLAIRKKIFVLVGISLVVAGNVMGVYHVLIHRQTTKNAWNIPLEETLTKMYAVESRSAKEVYFTHSPTFTYYLAESGKNLISFYNNLYFDSSRIKTSLKLLSADTGQSRNFTFVLTYRGKSISAGSYDEMIKAMNSIKADSVVRMYFGPDKEYKLKQKFFPDYPAYDVELIKFYGVKNTFDRLTVWENARQ